MPNKGTYVIQPPNLRIKVGGHGRMTKDQAKALRDQWEAKIYNSKDSDNGDNYPQSVTPP